MGGKRGEAIPPDRSFPIRRVANRSLSEPITRLLSQVGVACATGPVKVAIDRALRGNGSGICFARRDIHIRAVPPAEGGAASTREV